MHNLSQRLIISAWWNQIMSSSAFGSGTNTFAQSGDNPFGASAQPTTNAFGQPIQPESSAFGSNTSAFGAPKPLLVLHQRPGVVLLHSDPLRRERTPSHLLVYTNSKLLRDFRHSSRDQSTQHQHRLWPAHVEIQPTGQTERVS